MIKTCKAITRGMYGRLRIVFHMYSELTQMMVINITLMTWNGHFQCHTMVVFALATSLKG